MKEKIKSRKGFIQIPLLIIIIASVVVVAGVGTGVVLHKQGKLASLIANISQVFKGTEESVTAELEGAQSEPEEVLGSQEKKQKPEENQLESQHKTQSEQESQSQIESQLEPELESQTFYRNEKEELVKQLESYISAEEQKKEQTVLKFIAEQDLLKHNKEYNIDVALFFLPSSAVKEIIKKEAYLTGKGGYLGKITKNRFDSGSIFYKLGKYGNLIFGDGIWPTLSPNNPFSVIGEKPKIYLSDGTFFACLSIGLASTDCNNRILNPKRLILYMYDNYDIDKEYLDYIYK